MWQKIRTALDRIPDKVYYLILGLMAIPAYILGRDLLINQQTWYISIESQITVNLILFFYMFGWGIDKLTKKMSKQRQWAIWGVAVFILMIGLKYIGGLETWW